MPFSSLFRSLSGILFLSSGLFGDLVSHYQFDDPSSLGRDDGAFQLDGTSIGSAQFSSDARAGRGSLLLDGNGDALSLGGAADFSSLTDNGDGFTLAAWIKTESLAGVRRIFSTRMSEGFQGTGWGAGTSGASLFATTYGVRDFNADSDDLSLKPLPKSQLWPIRPTSKSNTFQPRPHPSPRAVRRPFLGQSAAPIRYS